MLEEEKHIRTLKNLLVDGMDGMGWDGIYLRTLLPLEHR